METLCLGSIKKKPLLPSSLAVLPSAPVGFAGLPTRGIAQCDPLGVVQKIKPIAGLKRE